MRILYVEDNATNVILVQRVANMGKHSVINYDNGEEALANFDKDSPDCVLLDVQLRGELSGLDVVAKLRARGVRLPIIALTAYAMKGDRQRCIDAGCDDYIPKPISVTELVSVFKRFNDAVMSSRSVTLVSGKSPFYKPPTTDEKKPSAEAAPPVPSTSTSDLPVAAEPAQPSSEVVPQLSVVNVPVTDSPIAPESAKPVVEVPKSVAPTTVAESSPVSSASTAADAADKPTSDAQPLPVVEPSKADEIKPVADLSPLPSPTAATPPEENKAVSTSAVE